MSRRLEQLDAFKRHRGKWLGRQLTTDDVAPRPAVSSAVAGDVVTVAGKRRPVAEKCDAEPIGYYCLPCHQPLANRAQWEMHVEHGTHVLARECAEHGLEVLAP